MPERKKYYEIRRSPIAGRGAFAILPIRKGTRIVEYTGEVITDAESDRRYPDDDDIPHHTFLFDIGWGKNVDASVNGGDAKYINHSCDPNCEATVEKRRIYIDAIRAIHPGEELFYDYQYARDGESDEEARRRYPCKCGAEKCRGSIMVAAKKKRGTKSARKKKGGKSAKKGVKKAPGRGSTGGRKKKGNKKQGTR